MVIGKHGFRVKEKVVKRKYVILQVVIDIVRIFSKAENKKN